MQIELTDQDLGLLESSLRKTAIQFWGEARAAEEMNPGEAMDKAITRMFTENAEKMKALYQRVREIRSAENIAMVFTADELSTFETSLRVPLLECLGQSTLYNLATYWPTTDDAEFRRIMAMSEGQSAMKLLSLSTKLKILRQ